MSDPIDVKLAILDSIAAALAPVVGAENVVEGYLTLDKAWRGKLVQVWPTEDVPINWLDGDNQRRKMDLQISLVMHFDLVKTQKQFRQLYAAWNPIQTAIEALVKNNCNGQAVIIREAGSGAVPSGVDDGDNIGAMVSGWEIEYDRNLTQVTQSD